MKDCYTCVYLNGAGYCSRSACTYLSENDLVPVIRCRDCTKYKQGMTVTEWYFCSMTGALVDGQDFCSWAERRNDETD